MTQHFFFRSFFFEHLPFSAFAKHFDAPFLSLHAASTDASAMNSIAASSNLLMTAMAPRSAAALLGSLLALFLGGQLWRGVINGVHMRVEIYP